MQSQITSYNINKEIMESENKSLKGEGGNQKIGGASI